jgi:HlyD family secretion protein
VAVALVIAAAAIAAPLTLHRLRGHVVRIYPARRADLMQTVVATGRVAALARVEVGSLLLGTVTRVLADEGERVVRGQVLVRLRDDEAQAAVSQAEAAVGQAEGRLRQLRETGLPAAEQAVRIADAELAASRQALDRTAALYERGLASKSDLDEARRALDTAEGRRDREVTLAAANRPGGGEFQMAVAAVDQARAVLGAARARLAFTVIAAPVDGTVVARAVEEGDTVQPGRVLMVLSRSGRTEIVAPVDEKNLALLRRGQKARISADAYPGESFAAELAVIVPTVTAASGTVTARFAVPDPPAYLLPDMTVSVEVEVSRKPAALTLPADAVRDLAGSPWVLAVRDGRAERVPVTLGIRGEGLVEILGGLDEGDPVIPIGEARAVAGEKVRPLAGQGG